MRGPTWTQKDLAWLSENYADMPLEEMASRLNRSVRAIKHVANALRLKRSKMYCTNHTFFETWSVDMAYVLGFTITDGCVSDGRLSYGVAQKDRVVLEYISQLLAPGAEVKDYVEFRNGKPLPTSRFKIGSKQILDSLRELGVCERKTGKETLPSHPAWIKPDLLRGIVDGDGGFHLVDPHAKTPQIRLSVTGASEEFLLQIQERLGFGYGTISRPGETTFRWNVYRQSHVKQIADFIYHNEATFFLQRKRDVFLLRNWNASKSVDLGRNRTNGELFSRTLVG